MDTSGALPILSALAQRTRLEIYRLLISAGAEGLAVGQIAEQVGAPHNTMSSHLLILARAGLVKSERSGKSTIYRARRDAAADLAAFLVRAS